MNNVIGPIEPEDWLTMLFLKRSINWSEDNRSRGLFGPTLEKEKSLLKEYLDKYLRAA